MLWVFLFWGALLYAQTIEVTSPNGGETWLIGSTHSITWTTAGEVGNVKIEYSGDNGSNWTEIIASTENDGTYAWTTPAISSANYLVRIGESDGDPIDAGNAVFTVSEGISGRVTDGSGNGIPNVTVLVAPQEEDIANTGVTDADGYYAVAISPGNWLVGFETSAAGNYISEIYNDQLMVENAALVTVTAGQTTTGINAQLAPGGIVSGRVTDGSGNGIPNVDINVQTSDYSIEPRKKTDANGYYTIQGMPTGNFQLQFETSSIFYVTKWYNNKHNSFDADYLYITAGQTLSNIDAQLDPGGQISGRVTDGSNNGIQGAEIRTLNSSNEIVDIVWTEEDGTYSTMEHKSPVGTFKIYCVPQYPEAYVREYYNNKTTFETADAVTLTAGQTLPDIDFQLDSGGAITGRVTNSSGNGIANIQIDVHIAGDVVLKSVTTDDNGDYRASGLQTGNYTLYFHPDSAEIYCGEWYNDKTYDTADNVAVTYGQTTPGIDAVLAAASTISGRVTDSNANGIQGVRVRLYYYNTGNVKTAITDVNGNYTLHPIIQDSCRVQFDARFVNGNFMSEWYNHVLGGSFANWVHVPPGQTVTLDYVLSPGGIISGRVTDTGGNGIADVSVRVLEAYTGTSVVNKVTDGNGNYTLQGLIGGNYHIFFNTDNTQVSYVPEYYDNKQGLRSAEIIAITPGQTIPGVDAVLAAGASISGRITDASSGNPVPDIDIYAITSSDTTAGCYSYTDENGDYILKGLPTGNFKINFNSYYYNMTYDGIYNDQWFSEKTTYDTATPLAVTAGQTISGINAALTQTGGIIRGRVTEEVNGWGVEGVRVLVMKDYGDFSSWEGRTDFNGDYQVSGMPTGQYLVIFYNSLKWQNLLNEVYNDKIFKGGKPLIGDWVSVAEGQVTGGINAVLSQGGTIEGIVTDTNGNPIKGIMVRLYEAGTGDYLGFCRSWTDNNGWYSIRQVRPGQMKTQFSSVEFGGQYKTTYYNGKNSLAGADAFMVTANQVTPDIDAVMTLGGGGTISGYVKNQNGNPVENAYVAAYDTLSQHSYLFSNYANSAGYFELKGLIPGSYKIYSNSGFYSFPDEWYNEKPTHSTADIVSVVEGGNTQITIILNDDYSLTLTSPNGGESRQAGTMHPVTWTNTGPLGNVKLEYSTNNGSSWTDIVASTENTGNYNWIVPAVPSTDCLVRISQVGGSAADVSNSVFTIFSNPADWTPIEGMQNNMIVHGTAYKGNTQASTGDWIGAFGPGGVSDCRGAAAVGANGSYYLTARSNAASGETISFKLFPLPSGPAIDSAESIEFISDNAYTDLPLHFGIATQSFPLVNGWNWISFQILPDNTTLNSVFAGLLGVVEQVKNQNKAAIYSGGSWIGDLTDMSGISTGIMYKVKTTQTCTLNVNGITIPYNTPLSLVLGWNWRAYLPTAPQTVENALNSILSSLNQVKSQTQSAIKIGGVLTGDLTLVEPKKGYTMKMTAPATLVYPYRVLSLGQGENERTGEKSGSPAAKEVPWIPIKGNQYNMVTYGKVFFEGMTVNSTDFYLVSEGPKGEGDCRSVSPIGTDGSYFSTILGDNNGEPLKFKLFHKKTGKTYDVVESVAFQSDTLKTDYNLKARSIKVTAPSGGEKFTMGSVCVVSWDAYNINTVKIELVKGDRTLSTIAASVSAGLKTYSWAMPSRMHAGNDYRIKISCVDQGVIAGDASNVFSIVPTSAITLNSPIGGDVWQLKRKYDITWGSSGISNIKIELYKGSTLNMVISSSTPAAPGKFAWEVPTNQPLGNDYKIKVSSVDTGINAGDMSKNPFSIIMTKNTAADFNNDGTSDILWRYYGAEGFNCAWLTGTGTGAKRDAGSITDPRLDPQAALIQPETDLDNQIAGTGDFNQDGKEDILWRNKITGSNQAWFMNGTDYVNTASLPSETNLSWNICGTADFNNDGKVDILLRNSKTGNNRVWLMNGITRISEATLTADADTTWIIGGAGDFDGDGKPDVLWRNTTNGNNRVWIMNGTALSRVEPLPAVNPDWEIVGTGDYDGNGKPDILWRNKVDGRNSAWIMDGLSRREAVNLAQVTGSNWKANK